MAHNPDKSRVLCAVAKTSYWTLKIVGWTAVALFMAAFLLGIGVKIYRSWTGWPNWTEWRQGLVALLVIGLITVVVIGVPMLLYAWAKEYRSDC